MQQLIQFSHVLIWNDPCEVLEKNVFLKSNNVKCKIILKLNEINLTSGKLLPQTCKLVFILCYVCDVCFVDQCLVLLRVNKNKSYECQQVFYCLVQTNTFKLITHLIVSYLKY